MKKEEKEESWSYNSRNNNQDEKPGNSSVQQQQEQQQEQTNVEVSTTTTTAIIKRPNLYEEIRESMSNAFFMFAFADIRDMAKNGDLNESTSSNNNSNLIEKLINLPIDAYDFITIYKENRTNIEKRLDSKERYEMYESFFNLPEDQQDQSEVYLRSAQMLHFADTNAEEECVFAIGINHITKMVTVSFRGSVTPKDFIQDAKAFFTPIPNPVKMIVELDDASAKELPVVDPLLIPRLRDNVHVHLGFREYLYGEIEIPFNIKKFVKAVQTTSATNYKRISKGSTTIVKKATDTLLIQPTNAITKTSKDIITKVTDVIVGTKEVPNNSNNNEKEENQDNIDTKVTEVIMTVVEDQPPDIEQGVITTSTTTTEIQKQKEVVTTTFKEVESVNNNNKVIMNDDNNINNNNDNIILETTSTSTTMKKRYEVILEMASTVLKENPGYCLYINGHSLGGALATMFAFEAAASDDKVIPKPVTCITTGAPKVGNLDYLHSFEVLEEQRKIRYMRVANFRDLVPLSPPRQTYNCISAMFCQGGRFRHVGIRLKLFPHGYIISYPPKTRRCPGIWLCDMIKIIRHYFYLILICPIICFCKNRYVYKTFRSEHTQLVYMDRLDACAEDLSDMYLDELYEERIQRSRMRLPTLHGSTHALRKKEDYKKDPSKFLFAILEV